MRKMSIVLGLLAGAAVTSASAQGFEADRLYYGGGVSLNSLSGWDDAVGFQIFAGYPLGFMIGQGTTAVEVGYMDSGDFEADTVIGTLSTSASGLWATGVLDYPLTPQLSALGRVGLDFGDDDGLMYGLGAGYDLNRQVEIRGEYVVRDQIDSIQLNFVYRP